MILLSGSKDDANAHSEDHYAGKPDKSLVACFAIAGLIIMLVLRRSHRPTGGSRDNPRTSSSISTATDIQLSSAGLLNVILDLAVRKRGLLGEVTLARDLDHLPISGRSDRVTKP